jgi:7-carboxy-7-deazaguanine synthase
MKISEIFLSIQGEGIDSGLPTIFIRTSGCNLSCSWCDTKYAVYGKEMEISDILNKCKKLGVKRICITGGEPLLQFEIMKLISLLNRNKYAVSIETNGSIKINKMPSNVRISLDIKCPSSGMQDKIIYDNLKWIKSKDQVKFIIKNQKDYIFAKKQIKKYAIDKKTHVIFQPVYQSNYFKILAENIIKDKLNVRLGLQIHKFIWGNKKGK